MLLTDQQMQNLRQQLNGAKSPADLLLEDPQLSRLLAKRFTFYVGADVCATDMTVVVKNATFEILFQGEFPNEHKGFEELMNTLFSLNPDKTYWVKVAIECTGPYHLALVRFLKENGVEVYLYNAQTAKHLAKAYLKEKKTDVLDASILANLLIDGKFPISIIPQDNPYLEIRCYARRTQRFAEQMAQAKTRLKDELTQASVGMLKVFRQQAVFNRAPMQLMKVYPLPADRLAAGVEAVTQILAHASHNKYGQAEAELLREWDAKNQGDSRLNDYFRQSIRDYIEEIETLLTKRHEYDEKIEHLTKDSEPAQNLLTLKGCGEKLMPIILSEAGNPDRFKKPDQFVGYVGMAPIEHESGPYKGEKHLKQGGSPRLSYACYMIANCIRRYDPRLKNLYLRVKERHLSAGKPKGIAHTIANCAVAREVALLIYWILKDNRPYFLDKADFKAYQEKKKSQT